VQFPVTAVQIERAAQIGGRQVGSVCAAAQRDQEIAEWRQGQTIQRQAIPAIALGGAILKAQPSQRLGCGPRVEQFDIVILVGAAWLTASAKHLRQADATTGGLAVGRLVDEQKQQAKKSA
jgi:hypothetical protein